MTHGARYTVKGSNSSNIDIGIGALLSKSRFKLVNKGDTMSVTIEITDEQLGGIVPTKKEKPAKIICKVDGELMEFKNEKALKAFMWSARPEKVIRYNLAGVVSVPFELVTE